jgi:hypothetical protein
MAVAVSSHPAQDHLHIVASLHTKQSIDENAIKPGDRRGKLVRGLETIRAQIVGKSTKTTLETSAPEYRLS